MYSSYFPTCLKYSQGEIGFNFLPSVLYWTLWRLSSLPSGMYNNIMMHFMYKIRFETVLHKLIKAYLRAYKAVSSLFRILTSPIIFVSSKSKPGKLTWHLWDVQNTTKVFTLKISKALVNCFCLKNVIAFLHPTLWSLDW